MVIWFTLGCRNLEFIYLSSKNSTKLILYLGDFNGGFCDAASEDSSSDDGDGESCGRGKRKRTARRMSPSYQSTPMLSSAAANAAAAAAAHKKGKRRVSARERNLRRLESNERERMRMHSLNDAFEVLFVISLFI